jgi:hypothetical protein
MHEASRRLLGVLLREIDGFNHRDSGGSSSDGSGGDSSKRSVVIGATNRRQDLDAALLSRCVGACFVFGAREGVGIALRVHHSGQWRLDGRCLHGGAVLVWVVPLDQVLPSIDVPAVSVLGYHATTYMLAAVPALHGACCASLTAASCVPVVRLTCAVLRCALLCSAVLCCALLQV